MVNRVHGDRRIKETAQVILHHFVLGRKWVVVLGAAIEVREDLVVDLPINAFCE